MKSQTGNYLESCRIEGKRDWGFNGAFRIPIGDSTSVLVLCSDGAGWDHVSVSMAGRCPTWDEMCQIKDLFFDSHECVFQYHPPKAIYVNHHPYCLHLWRCQGRVTPIPPSFLV